MVRRLIEAYAARWRRWIIDAETPRQVVKDAISLTLRVAMLSASSACF